jgi:hypothetical protein
LQRAIRFEQRLREPVQFGAMLLRLQSKKDGFDVSRSGPLRALLRRESGSFVPSHLLLGGKPHELRNSDAKMPTLR